MYAPTAGSDAHVGAQTEVRSLHPYVETCGHVSVFKSGRHRDNLLPAARSRTAPGCYDIREVVPEKPSAAAAFKSAVKRGITGRCVPVFAVASEHRASTLTPGPAAYSVAPPMLESKAKRPVPIPLQLKKYVMLTRSRVRRPKKEVDSLLRGSDRAPNACRDHRTRPGSIRCGLVRPAYRANPPQIVQRVHVPDASLLPHGCAANVRSTRPRYALPRNALTLRTANYHPATPGKQSFLLNTEGFWAS